MRRKTRHIGPQFMPFPFFDAPQREPSAFVGFAGNRIDRQAEARSQESLPAALACPDTRFVLSRHGRAYVHLGPPAGLAFSRADAEALGARLDHAVLLGRDADGPVVAAPGGLEPEQLPEGIKAIDHRSIYVQDLVGEAWLGALAQGASLLAWNGSARFCGRCGSPTEMRIGGYKRACTGCGAEHFPRTDPVAIMLPVDGGRCLMGRSHHFAPGMYSALAGFIEPGETIEDAVRRETREEAGVGVGRVVYHASQPWPFPHTLMIGCYVEVTADTLRIDRNELDDCRWFDRQEVRDMLAGRHPAGLAVPPAGAIATHLVRAWAEAD